MIETPLFLKLLSSDKFSNMHSLHFSDNLFWNTVANTDSLTKITKIRLVFDHLREQFSSVFRPYQKVCIDKSLVLWSEKNVGLGSTFHPKDTDSD